MLVRDFDVVICGGGVGGLTLAALLGRQDLSVLLVEKQRQYRMMHKGELIQPRTLQILRSAGLLGPICSAGAQKVTGLACRTARGADLVSLDYRLLDGPFSHGLVQSYKEMLTTLAGLLGPSVTVWRGSRAQSLLRDRSGRVCGVTTIGDDGPVDVRARLTVASDGHASRLRESAGIDVTPRRYRHQLVGFEMERASAIGSDMNAYLTPRGLRALFELPGGRARLYVQIPAESFRSVGRAGLPTWVDAVLRSTPALDAIADPLSRGLDTVQVLSAWQFVAPNWTRPGFALIGDAAHCVHPMVGQGMNGAIGDAWALAQVLTGPRAVTAARVDAALVRYEQERRPQVDYVARLSNNMARLLTTTSWLSKSLRPVVLRRNQANHRLRQRLTENVAGLTAQPLSLADWASVSGLFNRVQTPLDAVDSMAR
jgi:2-polyprenyl-6-methoxyphenol hydroxylase-like FAD-dependent oxidoreductase